MVPTKIKIVSSTSDPHKGLITSVTVDGMEMADKVSAVRFEAVGRDIPTVTLVFPVGEFEIVGLAHLQRTELQDLLSKK